MLKESFTEKEKIEIANKIKTIDLNTVEKEFKELQKIGTNASKISERSRIGNSVVDYFTFTQRLNTRGKYNVNYFEFIANLDHFKEKKFIDEFTKINFKEEIKIKDISSLSSTTFVQTERKNKNEKQKIYCWGNNNFW